MMTKNTDQIVLWLVDPFSKNPQLQRSAAIAARYYAQQRPIQIIPIYFFSAYLTGDFPLSLPREWILEVKQKAQEELQRITKGVRIRGLKPLHLVARPYFSLRESIHYLNQLIKRLKNVELIITSTHSRHGLARFVLGSFAETLLLHFKEVPTLFINPSWKRTSHFKNILFPTDFSPESKKAYLKILPLLKTYQSKVTLVHKIAFAWPPALMMTLDVGPIYEKSIELEIQTQRKEAQRWIEEGRKQGVEVHFFIDHHPEDSVVESILHYAKGKHAIIALAAKSGPITTTLLGSTTRSLVRRSPDPVWVIHPEEETQSRAILSSERTPLQKPLSDEKKTGKSAA